MERLTNMKCGRHENPVKFVEEFATVLQGAAAGDHVGLGFILLKALSNHMGLVSQLRSTFATTAKDSRTELDVAYIARMTPQLYVEQLHGQQWPAPQERPNRRKISGRVDKSYRKDKGRYPKPAWKQDHEDSQEKPSSSSSSSKNYKKQDRICWYCKKQWKPGHTCQEYYDRTPSNKNKVQSQKVLFSCLPYITNKPHLSKITQGGLSTGKNVSYPQHVYGH
jgi:hypothetical protein